MPPDTGQSKTEAPTPRRRQEARQQGQVAYSRELTGATLLLFGVLTLWLLGPGLALVLTRTLHEAVRYFRAPQSVEPLAVLLRLLSFLSGPTLVLLVLLVACALIVDLLQVGPGLSTRLLSPDPERLSPVRGWQRIVAGWWLRLLLNPLKAVAVGFIVVMVAWSYLRQRVGWWMGPETLAHVSWELVLRSLAGAGGALLVLAIGDYLYNRWRHEQELRMTRQELKEELKREEGDPMMRARIRSLQREYARRRMLEDVRRATVVVTNPTHVAVALRYERGRTAAPVVVAKGVDFLALKIIEVARQARVPVVQRPQLARELYRHVQIGQEIPVSLYIAVAQVLAFVYKLTGRANRAA